MAEKKDKKDKEDNNPQISKEKIEEAKVEKAEKVNKKIIYVELDDEVSSIYDKIKKIKLQNIYLIVPEKAVIFQSPINLKILKRKADEKKKKIFLVTNDHNGLHLAKKAGIEVDNNVGKNKNVHLFNNDNESEEKKITPLKAAVNSVEEHLPTRRKEKKLSISEILKKTQDNQVNVNFSKVKNSQKKEKEKKNKFTFGGPNKHLLIGFIGFSLVLLLIIVYIALPGATIYLTPKATILEKWVNITLADSERNSSELASFPAKTIASYPLDVTVSEEIDFQATGKSLAEGTVSSSGVLTVFNNSNREWDFVANTRFQTNEGLVFRSSVNINVPAATQEGPGQTEVFVTADPLDANDVFVGERGNIGPSTFFLPGLREESREEVYAESYEPMTGGVSDFFLYVSEEDVDAAKQKLSNELEKKALEELNLIVENKNEDPDDNYTLLEGENAIRLGEVNFTFNEEDLVGKPLEQFVVSGDLNVQGIYFEKNQMLEILKSELLLKKSPQKELVKINEETTTYRIIEWNEASGKIKITANIKGIEQYTIDPDKENGKRLLEKIEEHVLGMDVDEAIQYIQNQPEINTVEIDSWPAWSPSIPNIADNVDFEIREAVTVE